MGRRSVHHAWLAAAGILCLSVAVLFLSTYSKTCQYGSDDVRGQYLCKAAGTAGYCQPELALAPVAASVPPPEAVERRPPPALLRPQPYRQVCSPASYFRPPPAGV